MTRWRNAGRRVAVLQLLCVALFGCNDRAVGTDGHAQITISVSGLEWYAIPGETVHINVTYRGQLNPPYDWDETLGETEFERSEMYDVTEAGFDREPRISVAGLREGSWRVSVVIGMTWSTDCTAELSSTETTRFTFVDRTQGCELD